MIKTPYLALITLLALSFIQTNAHAAKVYKWTDANGQVHFSQFPPGAQKQAESVDVKTTQGNAEAGREELNNLRDKLKQDIDARNKRKEDAEEQKKKNAVMAENCKRSKERLAMLKNGGRFYKMKEDGEREWYDEKQTLKSIQAAQADVDKYCK